MGAQRLIWHAHGAPLDALVSCKRHVPVRWAAVSHPQGRAFFPAGHTLLHFWYTYHSASPYTHSGKKRSGEIGQYLCSLV